MSANAVNSKGAAYWVERLSQVDMPILSMVVNQLNRLTGDEDTEINQLAEVILKDPHMTSQILKIANSVQLNPTGSSVNTVSRAIVLLGFRGVRNLCISLMVIDTLLTKQPRERLLQVMAKSFQSAVQAREIYRKVEEKGAEEVFIAALLSNLGEMAFWASGGKSVDQFAAGANIKDIERAMGTSFKVLTKELGRVWKLGDTLQESLSPEGKVSSRAEAVRLGEALSQLDFEDTEKRQALFKKVANFTGDSLSATKRLVEASTDQAASVAVEYGAKSVCHLIPSQKEITEKEKSKDDSDIQVLQPDQSLQLKILRDLANTVSDQVDVNTVFQMALEGMHRGVGLERVVLAFFIEKSIKTKYVLGQFTDGWREKFFFPIEGGEDNIFSFNLDKQQPIWINEQYITSHQHLYPESVKSVIGCHPSIIGVLRVNGRNAALFYADRGDTQQAIKTDHYESFKHFLSQAELSIQAMADKRRH